MMHRLSFVVAVLVILSACVGLPKVRPISPHQQNIKEPKIGDITERGVGETLVDQSSLRVYRGIQFHNNIEFLAKRNSGSKGIRVRVSAGTKFMSDIYLNGEPAFCGAATWDTTIFQQGFFQPTVACVIVRAGTLYDQLGELLTDSNGHHLRSFRKIDIVKPNSGGIRQRLLYSGRIGNHLILSYREFVNNLSRPAFTQELNFDISSDHTIGFRSARIEVINATNTIIQYRVLRHFDSFE